MKKNILLLLGLVMSFMAYAQCPIEGTDAYPVPVDSSLLTINGARRADCDAYIKGSFNPLYVHRCGVPTNGYSFPDWYYGILCESDYHDSGYNFGVVGRVMNDGNHHTSGRAYGVMGGANGYASGYIYGMFGRLEGYRNGAAVYGTSTANSNGIDTGGRYAGFFHGNVRVTDTLKTATIYSNAYLGPAFSQETMMNMPSTCSEEGYEVSNAQKLRSLSEYVYVAEEQTPVIPLNADTIDYESLNLTDKAYYSRSHHGLSADEVMKVFPELIYEVSDGSKGINYMELIPILVQAINDLQAEIDELKGVRSPSRPMMAPTQTTGFNATPTTEGNSSTRYDLQGRRVKSEAKSNVIIRDGQKTIVK